MILLSKVMNEKHKLYLLPGLDGSGDFFAKIYPYLSNEIKTEILPYGNQYYKYDKIFNFYKNKLKEENIYLLAESFGGPLAYKFSQLHNVKKIIFSASFISCPYRYTGHLKLLNSLILSHHIPNPFLGLFLANSLNPFNNKCQKIIKLNLSLPPKTIQKRIFEVLTLPEPTYRISQPVLYLKAKQDRLISYYAPNIIKKFSNNFYTQGFNSSHLLLEECPQEASHAILKFIKS